MTFDPAVVVESLGLVREEWMTVHSAAISTQMSVVLKVKVIIEAHSSVVHTLIAIVSLGSFTITLLMFIIL